MVDLPIIRMILLMIYIGTPLTELYMGDIREMEDSSLSLSLSFFLIFISFTALGLSHGIQDLQSLLQHVRSSSLARD